MNSQCAAHADIRSFSLSRLAVVPCVAEPVSPVNSQFSAARASSLLLLAHYIRILSSPIIKLSEVISCIYGLSVVNNYKTDNDPHYRQFPACVSVWSCLHLNARGMAPAPGNVRSRLWNFDIYTKRLPEHVLCPWRGFFLHALKSRRISPTGLMFDHGLTSALFLSYSAACPGCKV